ncbi:hypothetical protein N780_02440 [Pontibacillus chungwhensis BH030062]|uniref:Uncharacterized protein n=1 Tax=Pontibacillus chungwhensis BH030062 TaxID=1385513 RepID=A0A0A2USR0_9BACI|nr:hypothetical protein [Pontibacillus chungwhensis]KGP90954.1 hypothetical protein N780_02440 [Pontibacillus chungwhensis BH030062]
MSVFNGNIFEGEFAHDLDSFYVKSVKSVETGSNLSEDQVEELLNYLVQHQGQSTAITINDQMPMMLEAEEVQCLIGELRFIKSHLD